MLDHGIGPSPRSLVCALKACASLGHLEHGKAIHGLLSHGGGEDLLSNTVVANSLIGMYGKCGDVVMAENVFARLRRKSTVSWNSMLSAYVGLGKPHLALLLYRQMKHEGVNPDAKTFSIILHGTRILSRKEGSVSQDMGMELELSRAIHSDFHQKHRAPNAIVANCLMSVYGECGSIEDAENVLLGFRLKYDVISWTVMLSIYAKNAHEKKALQLYMHMQQEGVSPNEQTSVSALQACGILVETQGVHQMSLDIGRSLHADAVKRGYTSNIFVCNTILSFYGKCGLVTEAEHIFHGMSQRTTMSWSAMVCAYVHRELGHKALDLYIMMRKKGIIPDHVILLSLVQACGVIRNVERCRQLHMEIVALGYDQMQCITSALICVYGGCTHVMLDAKSLFNQMIEPDIVSWNAYIAGYACLGDHVSCLHAFELLKKTQTKPNEVTFLLLLSACSHSGLVHRGLQYFESLSRDYGLRPGLKHYSSIIEMLGQTGDFRVIELILRKMPMEPNLTIWLSLLGGCYAYGHLGKAQKAFERVMKLQCSRTEKSSLWF
jgi:pentatricopeptide repeat protein